MTLKEAELGEELRVVKVEPTLKRFKALGLREGKRVVVLQRLGRNLLIRVGRGKYAIDVRLAKLIKVKR